MFIVWPLNKPLLISNWVIRPGGGWGQGCVCCCLLVLRFQLPHILGAWRCLTCGLESLLGLCVQSHLLFFSLSKSCIVSSCPSPGRVLGPAYLHVKPSRRWWPPSCQGVPGKVQFCHAFLLTATMDLLPLRVACPHLLEDRFAVKIMSN